MATKKFILPLFVLVLLFCGSVYAGDFVPSGHINGRGIYYIYNFPFINATNFCLGSTCISSWGSFATTAGLDYVNNTATYALSTAGQAGANASSINASLSSYSTVTATNYVNSTATSALSVAQQAGANASSINASLSQYSTVTATNYVNTTAVGKAGTGTASCSAGYYAQNITTTTGGVTTQCMPDQSGAGGFTYGTYFDQYLNTTSNVTFNKINNEIFVDTSAELIQALANAKDNQTITVLPGTYDIGTYTFNFSNLEFTLRGSGGDDSIIKTNLTSGYVFNIVTMSHSRIENLRFENNFPVNATLFNMYSQNWNLFQNLEIQGFDTAINETGYANHYDVMHLSNNRVGFNMLGNLNLYTSIWVVPTNQSNSTCFVFGDGINGAVGDNNQLLTVDCENVGAGVLATGYKFMNLSTNNFVSGWAEYMATGYYFDATSRDNTIYGYTYTPTGTSFTDLGINNNKFINSYNQYMNYTDEYFRNYSNAVPKTNMNGLIMYYPFDGNSKDYSGLIKDAQGNPQSYSNDSIYGSSAYFNTSKINGTEVNLTEGTIMFWGKFNTSTQSTRAIVCTDFHEYCVYQSTTGTTMGIVSDDGDVGRSGFLSGTWNHYAVTFDGSNSLLYKNGEYVATLAVGIGTLNSNRFSIGGSGGSATSYQLNDSYLDDVMLFNRSLSQLEIREYYREKGSYFNPNAFVRIGDNSSSTSDGTGGWINDSVYTNTSLNISVPYINGIAISNINDGSVTAGSFLMNVINNSAAGTEILLPCGTYAIYYPIHINNRYVNIQGMGKSCTIIKAGTGFSGNNMFIVNNEYFNLKDVKLDANNSVNVPIWINGSASDFIIDNVMLQNYLNTGIYIGQSYYGEVINPSMYMETKRNVTFMHWNNSNQATLFGGDINEADVGLRMTSCSGCKVIGTNFENADKTIYSNGTAILIEGSGSRGIDLTDLRIELWKTGIYIANTTDGYVHYFGGRQLTTDIDIAKEAPFDKLMRFKEGTISNGNISINSVGQLVDSTGTYSLSILNATSVGSSWTWSLASPWIINTSGSIDWNNSLGQLYYANKTYVDNNVLNVTALFTSNASQAGQISALITDNTTKTTQITNLQTDNTTQASLIAMLRTDNTTQGTLITNLQTDNTTQGNLITALFTSNTSIYSYINALLTDNSTKTTQITNLQTDNTTQASLIAMLRTDNTTQSSQLSILTTDNLTQAGHISSLTSNATTYVVKGSSNWVTSSLTNITNGQANLTLTGYFNVTKNITLTTDDSCLLGSGGGKICFNTTCTYLVSPNGVTVMQACN